MGIYSGEKTCVIAGGGLTSLCVLDGFVNNLAADRPACRLVWITGGGKPGRGAPYQSPAQEDAGAPILNQPAYAMSPFARHPEDYADWLAQNTKIPNPRHAFTTRGLFGDYCESAASRLLRNALEIPHLKIEIVETTVTTLHTDAARNYRVELGNGHKIHVDRVIVAAGHTRSTRFDHLKGYERYIAAPDDRHSLRSLAETSTPDSLVTFFGCGASMLDALRALEAEGYRGRYEAIGHGWNFWAVEAEKYDPANPSRVRNFTLDQASIDRATSGLAQGRTVHEVLQDLYRIHGAREPRLGFDHVQEALPLAAIGNSLRQSSQYHAAREVEIYHQQVTAPEALRLLEDVQAQGRMKFHKGSVRDIDAQNGGFTICFEDGTTKLATTLVNAAPYVKGVGTPQNGHTPLFTQLIADHLVRIDAKGIVETNTAFEARPGLAIVGPASHRGKAWGVESFRETACAAGAAQAVALHSNSPFPKAPRLPLPLVYPQTERGSAHVYQ